MKQHKGFFLTLLALAMIGVAGSFGLIDSGLGHTSSVSQSPEVPLVMAGFFGSVFGGIKKAVGGGLKVFTKIAPIIPGVGTVVAGLGSAYGALTSGGQVQTVTPASLPGGVPSVQTIGTAVARPQLQNAGFGGDLMNYKLMGIPIVPVLLIGMAFTMFKGRRR